MNTGAFPVLKLKTIGALKQHITFNQHLFKKKHLQLHRLHPDTAHYWPLLLI